MIKKANALYLLTASVLIIATAVTYGGVFESLNKELTGLVKRAEPFLVTIEAGNSDIGKMLVGSGVLLSNEGYILTAASVVDGPGDIRVVFHNGESFAAELEGSDQYSGLALLKIEPVDRDLPKLGDPYKLEEGSWVIAIGNSFDMPSAVSLGVFSGLTDMGLMQLSLQSSPGGAGGAVFNTDGELVGILIAQPTSTFSLWLPPEEQIKRRVKSYGSDSDRQYYGIDLPSTGTSLAVPANKIDKVIDQLKKHGEVKHGYLGIRQARLTQKEKSQYNLEGGVVVKDVIDDAPGARAGLKTGDILVKYNGIIIKGPGHLMGLVRSSIPGDTVHLEIQRDSTAVQASAVLGEAPRGGYFGAGNIRGNFLGNDYDRLSDKTLTLQNQLKNYSAALSDLKAKDSDIKRLNEKLDDLQNRLDELSAKIADLYQKLENK